MLRILLSATWKWSIGTRGTFECRLATLLSACHKTAYLTPAGGSTEIVAPFVATLAKHASCARQPEKPCQISDDSHDSIHVKDRPVGVNGLELTSLVPSASSLQRACTPVERIPTPRVTQGDQRRECRRTTGEDGLYIAYSGFGLAGPRNRLNVMAETAPAVVLEAPGCLRAQRGRLEQQPQHRGKHAHGSERASNRVILQRVPRSNCSDQNDFIAIRRTAHSVTGYRPAHSERSRISA